MKHSRTPTSVAITTYILLTSPAFGTTSQPCSAPRVSQDIVTCALLKSPEIQRTALIAAQTEASVDLAKQIPNPSLESSSDFGSQSEIELALVQPIELGGKRGARIRLAEVQSQIAQGNQSHVASRIVTQTVLKLHRQRQLLQEQEIVNEGIQTFSKLIQQYRSRPKLPPEQEVALTVYRMAKADYEAKASALGDEARSLERFFRTSTGFSLNDIKRALPEAPHTWPEISSGPEPTALSPRLSVLASEKELALAELATSQASVWPDLALGPKIKWEKENTDRATSFGFALSLTLPLWNAGSASRTLALRGVTTAEGNFTATKHEETEERAELVQVYQNAVQLLRSSQGPAAFEKSHQDMDRLFLRGLISSSLVVEAHRQLSELQKSRHERELRAIEALWTIYALDGRIFKETL